VPGGDGRFGGRQADDGREGQRADVSDLVEPDDGPLGDPQWAQRLAERLGEGAEVGAGCLRVEKVGERCWDRV
jgi:hypothetical protein